MNKTKKKEYLKPGRELDELVAEKVEGWRFECPEDGLFEFDGDIQNHRWVDKKGYGHGRVFEYSTDIKVAMKLLSDFGGSVYTPQEKEAYCREDKWSACLFDKNKEYSEWGYGESPEHAICQAALRVSV